MVLSPRPLVALNHPTGQLSLAQRWHMVVAALFARTARRKGASPVAPSWITGKLIATLRAPGGDLATRAWQLAEAHQPEWLNQHVLRTWAWAQALGVLGDWAFDRQQLFAATALHDIGLTPAAASPPDHCFALRGARYAAQVLQTSAPAQDVIRVADAIVRHIDMQVPPATGVEAHLLQAGAMVDVLGRGLARLPDDYRRHVLASHPRHGMKQALCRCMHHEANQAPQTRMGLYVRRLGFIDLIQRAGFDA